MPAIKDFKIWGGSCLNCGGVMGAVGPKHLAQKRFCGNACCGEYKRSNKTVEMRSKEALSKSYSNMNGNPEKYILHLIRKPNRKHLNIKDMLALLEVQEGLCALSGEPLTFVKEVGREKVMTNLSIDRIDSSKGYELDNIQFVCTLVNIMKSDLSLDEFYWWCEQTVGGQDV